MPTEAIEAGDRNMAKNLRDKVVGAFKGFIRTYKLLPVKERDLIEESEYIGTFQLFRSETEWSRLFYKKRSYGRLIDLVDRLFHGQTDSKFVSRCLGQVATEWIEQGYSTDDQARLEQSAADFLEKVGQGIKNFVLYVPIERIGHNIIKVVPGWPWLWLLALEPSPWH